MTPTASRETSSWWRFWYGANEHHYRCADCAAALNLHGVKPGGRARCGKCGSVFEVPGGLPSSTRAKHSTQDFTQSALETLDVEPLKPVPTVTGQSGRLEKIGPYQLESEIARGGTAVVFKARHETLGKYAAIKLVKASLDDAPETKGDQRLLGEMGKRLLREALALARFRHPYIVPVLDAGLTSQGQAYLIMELVDGEDLARKVAREGPIPWKRALEILDQILSGVDFAHSHGVVHRDLKPANVLLNKDGFAQLVDFGLARDESKDSRLTRSGVALGTPAYMPPEQARGDREKIDRRSDVYSIGAILYEMLTGRPPFRGKTVMEVLYNVLHEPPTSPRSIKTDIPIEVEAVCLMAMEKDPLRRYTSAHQMREDVRAILAGEMPPSIGRPRIPGIFRGFRGFWQRRGSTALAALAGAAAMIGLAILGAHFAEQDRINRGNKVALEGQTLLQAGKVDEADERFIEAQRHDPQNAMAYRGRKDIRLERERLKEENAKSTETLEKMRKALSSLDPDKLKNSLQGGATKAVDVLTNAFKEISLNGVPIDPANLDVFQFESTQGPMQLRILNLEGNTVLYNGATPYQIALDPGYYWLETQVEKAALKRQLLTVNSQTPKKISLPLTPAK